MDLSALFDQLCLRWAQEADVVAQQTGRLDPTLIVLPRDATADEVAIRLEGLRGNLPERADAILADLRPQVSAYDPAGLVFMSEVKDGAVIYVSLGAAPLRRVEGFRIVDGVDGVKHLERTGELDATPYAWLDALLTPRPPR